VCHDCLPDPQRGPAECFYDVTAYLQHGINRAIILDIDLHHGNGTQALAFSINQEAHRRDLENAAKRKAAAHQHDVEPKMSNELKIYYASLHDILSFPCEVRY
jgi:histone deacetylase HOS3